MTKAPKQLEWNSFTKAELIKTIKTLNKRQTTLLNKIAKLEAAALTTADRLPAVSLMDDVRTLTEAAFEEAIDLETQPVFPWDATPLPPNPFDPEGE